MTTHLPVPTTQELLEDLRRICAETAEVPFERVTVDADLAADLGIDSLTQGELVETVLERYGLSAHSSSVQATSYPTVGALAGLVQQLTGEKSSEPDD